MTLIIHKLLSNRASTAGRSASPSRHTNGHQLSDSGSSTPSAGSPHDHPPGRLHKTKEFQRKVASLNLFKGVRRSEDPPARDLAAIEGIITKALREDTTMAVFIMTEFLRIADEYLIAWNEIAEAKYEGEKAPDTKNWGVFKGSKTAD